MSTSLNRRTWLKSGALLAAGFGTGAAMGFPSLAKAGTVSHLSTTAIPSTNMAEVLAKLPKMQARLTSNENPYGPSQKAKEALIGAIEDSFRYPREKIKALQEAIAEEEGVAVENILLGAGSSELLMAAALRYAAKGSSILSADPTYNSLIRTAVNHGSGWIKVPLTADYSHDLEAMEKQVNDDISLVYIVNPNNPTGTITNSDKLRVFCDRVTVKKPVFIDEAYMDYVQNPKQQSMVDCVQRGKDVIVARTFSKVHGFAGLRVGYVVALPETIKALNQYTNGRGNISATSASAALASLHDKEFVADCVMKNQETKDFLYTVLKNQGYTPLDSHTNFVMFPIKMRGERFTQEMLKRGVGLRSWEFYGQQWCRVSLGTMEDMELFASAFGQIS